MPNSISASQQSQEITKVNDFNSNNSQTNLNDITQTTKNPIKIGQEEKNPNITNNETNNLKQTENSTTGISKIYDSEMNQLLEGALTEKNNSENQLSGNDPQILPKSKSSDGTTITEKTSSRQHPHLSEKTNESVQAYFNPDSQEVNTKDAETLINKLKEQGLIDTQGNINFTAFELDQSTIEKAGIKGTIFIKDGQFDFHITGECSNEAVTCMQAFKDKLEKVKEKTQPKLNVPININPETVGPLDKDDLAALANDGQIQYRVLPDGETIKTTVDPNKKKLTISVYEAHKPPVKENIKVGPEAIQSNHVWDVIFPNNTDKTDEAKANAFWNYWAGVGKEEKCRIIEEYLKASVESSAGSFSISNATPNTQPKTIDNNNSQNIIENTEKQNQTDDIKNNSNLNSNQTSTNNIDNANNQDEVKSQNSEITNDNSETSHPTGTQKQDKTTSSPENNNTISLETISSKQGESYSNQLKELKEKAQKGNLTLKDIKTFQQNLPEPVQNLLNNYLRSNNINFMSIDTLNTRFKDLTLELCNEMDKAIAQIVTSQNQKIIQEERKSIENPQTDDQLQPVNNNNDEKINDVTIEEHFKQLDEKINDIKKSTQNNEWSEFETKYSNYKQALQSYANRPNKSPHFNELLTTIAEEINQKLDLKEIESLLKMVTEDLKVISDFEDKKKREDVINFEELSQKEGIAKNIIGMEMITALSNNGISTTNETAEGIINQLAEFQKTHAESNYKALLNAFIEHKKNQKNS